VNTKSKTFKKAKNFQKKVLTNGNVFGILIRRSRERVENRLDDSAKTKALCKLNNTKKTRNPEINLSLKSIFRTVLISQV